MRHLRMSCLTLLFGTSLCFAEASNYNYAQAGYNTTELDIPAAPNIDFEGFDVEGSWNFYDAWYASATYYNITTSDPIDINGTLADVDLEFLTLNVGYIFASNDVGSLFGEVGFAEQTASASVPGLAASVSETGFQGGLGFRANMGSRMEMKLSVNYVDVDVAEDTFFGLDVLYHFFQFDRGVESLSGLITYTVGEDTESFLLGLRLNF